MVTRLSILFVILLSIGCGSVWLPTESEMTENFYANKDQFQKLASMLEEDKQLVRLSRENTFYESNEARAISQERIDSYRKILEAIKIEDGIHRDDPNSVKLIASAEGFPVPRYSKAFLYTSQVPEPLVESIDKFVSTRKSPPVYKKLEDNWYLVYESW